LTLLARDGKAIEAHAARLAGVAVRCDLALPDDVDRALSQIIKAIGAPDILVNNAGLFHLASIDHTTPESFAAALDVNLIAPFRFIRGFLPMMRDRARGDIVSIGSIADHMTLPENAAYGTSKQGLRALHDVMRLELRGSGVRATLISPGPVNTPLWNDIDPDTREGFTPREMMLLPNAVASAVLYAVSQPPEVDVELVRLSRS
jgi:NADP-dependent 3-hydroxy acid dehydrogenase YdfG